MNKERSGIMKHYQNPEVELVTLHTADVITWSLFGIDSGTDYDGADKIHAGDYEFN